MDHLKDYKRKTQAERYTRTLAEAVHLVIGFDSETIDVDEVETIIGESLNQVFQDLRHGRPVSLERLGDFQLVDNHGPQMRYMADAPLLEYTRHQLQQVLLPGITV